MNARSIVRDLKGHWHGQYGSCRCPAHDDRRPSLLVSDGDNGLVVNCQAGCDWRDVKAALRTQGLLPDWKGQAAAVPTTTATERQARQEAEDREKASRTAVALAIWRECQPAPGTPVSAYLESRGITIPVPPSIRFHPALIHRPTGLTFPTQVAGVQDVDGRIMGIHRTFLLPGGRGKAGVRQSRMALGPIAGGAIRLAAAGDRLGLAEGIETALSVQQATGLPMWACISTSGLKAVKLPPQVREVVLCADGDEPGQAAAKAAAQRFIGEGRVARNASPPPGFDFNDMLRLPENVALLDTRRRANGHG